MHHGNRAASLLRQINPAITATVEALLSHTRSRAHNDLPRARNQKIVKNSCRLLCLLIESPQADTLL